MLVVAQHIEVFGGTISGFYDGLKEEKWSWSIRVSRMKNMYNGSDGYGQLNKAIKGASFAYAPINTKSERNINH